LGSSGVYHAGPGRSADEAERVFRSSLDELKQSTRPEGAVRNVFISFHSEDEAQVALLRQHAKTGAGGLDFRDYSIKEPFDEKWKTNCKERISQTSATIVMIGPETANRDAVNWEIEESYRQGHKVIGVRIYKDRRDPVPKLLREHGAPVIDWDTEEISQRLSES